MATRDNHLAWAKERALEYVVKDDLDEAFASLANDMSRHPQLRTHPQLILGARLWIEGHFGTPETMRAFIESFE
jgi:hypothetical protein